jgi:uncharacterized membrane protein
MRQLVLEGRQVERIASIAALAALSACSVDSRSFGTAASGQGGDGSNRLGASGSAGVEAEGGSAASVGPSGAAANPGGSSGAPAAAEVEPDGGAPPGAETVGSCAASPCLNGGVCSETAVGHVCDCVGLAFAGAECALPRFQPLPFLGGAGVYVSASDVSADGSIVVGSATDFGGLNATFRWSVAGGLEDMTPVIGTSIDAISADGLVLCGTTPGASEVAFRWTAAGGSTNLPAPDGLPRCWCRALNADGSRIAGTCYNAGNTEWHPVRWLLEDGTVTFVVLPNLGAGNQAEAHGISDDGALVAGDSFDAGGHAVLWNLSGPGDPTVLDLGLLPSAGSYPTARAIAAAGAVVVGDDGTNGFRWTQPSGIQLLPQPSPADPSSSVGATGVDASGAVSVGFSIPSAGGFATDALLWNLSGAHHLRDVLIAAGVNPDTLAGWSLGAASAISADGSTIVGGGTNPDGVGEAWIARLR